MSVGPRCVACGKKIGFKGDHKCSEAALRRAEKRERDEYNTEGMYYVNARTVPEEQRLQEGLEELFGPNGEFG
jgi:hypothetical protein